MNENTSYEEKIKEAVEKIIEIYQKNKKNENIKKIIDNEKPVLEKWSKIFNINNIDNINKDNFEDILKFFDWPENHHWKRIYRTKNKIKFEDFKEGLKILLDESKSVGERLNKFKKRVKYMSIAMTTPILLVSNPEKYGVWNNLSENALKKLGLWKEEWRKNRKNYTLYNEINDLLIKLRDGVREKIPEENFNLWKLDAVLGIFGKENKNKIKENKEESETNQIRWWVEIRNMEKNPDNHGINIGYGLISSQKDKGGRHIYENMKKVKKGDRVIHLIIVKDKRNKRIFSGISLVEDSYKEYYKDIKEVYYVPLKDYTKLKPPINWNKFKSKYKKELIEIYNIYKKNLFYNKNLNLNQGAYLTEVPKEFIDLLNKEYLLISQQSIPHYNESEKIIIEGDNKIPKNIILHGPVGTGKTYFATILGKGIINGDIKNLDNLEEWLLKLKKGDKSLDELYKKRIDYEGIKKITFHKSYS
ncbi:MAG: hypothetical protein ACP5GR_06160, partial [Thermoplasmata archaeon]